jgi:folate-binding protein YgfZ
MQNKLICVHAYRPTAVLRVTGEDAFTFLQGQFTNELRQVADSVVYGLWLNQKGKVLADSHVLRLEEKEFVLVSPRSANVVIRRRLEDYVVADDVAVTDKTDTVHGLALWGVGCGERLSALLGAVPDRGKFLRKDQLLIFAGRRTGQENYEIIGPGSKLTELRESFKGSDDVETGFDEAEVVRLQAGIPAVPADIGPNDLPNEGELEHTALSYTKGCYLGQEVMARIKNLGQVRRHLRVVQGVGVAPKPGSPLFQDGRKTGEIRSVAPMADGFIAMAMLTKLGLKENAGLAFSADGPEVARMRSHE